MLWIRAGGKTGKNRLHLEINPTDREQDDEVQGDQGWVVLADPEGNEFCVLASRRP